VALASALAASATVTANLSAGVSFFADLTGIMTINARLGYDGPVYGVVYMADEVLVTPSVLEEQLVTYEMSDETL
jgi:hypothetical protein